MTRGSKGGMFIGIGGILAFISLPLWAIFRFMMSSMARGGASAGTLGSSDVTTTVVRLGNVLISLMPLVGIFILIPIGIYLLVTKGKKQAPMQQQPPQQ